MRTIAHHRLSFSNIICVTVRTADPTKNFERNSCVCPPPLEGAGNPSCKRLSFVRLQAVVSPCACGFQCSNKVRDEDGHAYEADGRDE